MQQLWFAAVLAGLIAGMAIGYPASRAAQEYAKGKGDDGVYWAWWTTWLIVVMWVVALAPVLPMILLGDVGLAEENVWPVMTGILLVSPGYMATHVLRRGAIRKAAHDQA